MIKLACNGTSAELDEGSTLLDAAREPACMCSRSVTIHAFLPMRHAACACVTKASDGDVVETDSCELQELESPADIGDLTLVRPTGERCRFDVEVGTAHEGAQSRMAIRKLVRQIL